ncbi:MAG: SOS response-associated peptidase family protein [Faecousia sp.]
MIRTILEYLEHCNVKGKTGDVFPGDAAAVVASNRHCESQPFAMEWGYHLPDGKRIINARSETAAQKAMFADGIRQRRCLILARQLL